MAGLHMARKMHYVSSNYLHHMLQLHTWKKEKKNNFVERR
jgi:hypothetical protein